MIRKNYLFFQFCQKKKKHPSDTKRVYFEDFFLYLRWHRSATEPGYMKMVSGFAGLDGSRHYMWRNSSNDEGITDGRSTALSLSLSYSDLWPYKHPPEGKQQPGKLSASGWRARSTRTPSGSRIRKRRSFEMNKSDVLLKSVLLSICRCRQYNLLRGWQSSKPRHRRNVTRWRQGGHVRKIFGKYFKNRKKQRKPEQKTWKIL